MKHASQKKKKPSRAEARKVKNFNYEKAKKRKLG